MAPNSSHSRDLAASGRDVVATPEPGDGQLLPDPPLAAPFFESFFFFEDISLLSQNSYSDPIARSRAIDRSRD